MRNKITYTPAELAMRWEIHRSSVGRVMTRYGCSGLKFGASKQAARRFTAADVAKVELLAGFGRREDDR